VFFDAKGYSAAPAIPSAADLSSDNVGPVATVLASDKPTRARGPHAHFEDYVAHVSTVPRMCVTNACSSDISENVEDFVALRDFSIMVAHPRHKSTEGPVVPVAFVSASVCVEPTPYQAALVSPVSADWQKAMLLELDSMTTNHTWGLIPLPT
jgi:hypothetical protein